MSITFFDSVQVAHRVRSPSWTLGTRRSPCHQRWTPSGNPERFHCKQFHPRLEAMEAISIRLEAIAIRLEAIAITFTQLWQLKVEAPACVTSYGIS